MAEKSPIKKVFLDKKEDQVVQIIESSSFSKQLMASIVGPA